MKSDKTIIPAGYRLTVSTWENDADNRQIRIIEGLTSSRTSFLVAICKLFKSKNQVKGCIGNIYDPTPAERTLVETKLAAVVAAHSGEWPHSTNGDDMQDLLRSLGLKGDDFYTRVMESFKVEHVPVEIVMTDCTNNF